MLLATIEGQGFVLWSHIQKNYIMQRKIVNIELLGLSSHRWEINIFRAYMYT